MDDGTKFGLSEAARRLGVPLRVLRQAIRSGRLPPVAGLSATSSVSATWLARAEAAGNLRAVQQKVPPFARYEGTSAWRKYRDRVRAYERFRAAAAAAA